MSVVSLHVDASAKDGDATIDVAGGIINEPVGNGARVMPKDLASSRVERIGIVGAGDEHNTGDNDWGDFENPRIAAVKDPLGAKQMRVFGSDLDETGIATASVVSVVRWPVFPEGGR